MAFQQGLSGLNASSKGLDVVGNNVANSSTVGFKSASGHFADLYAASLSGGSATQVGIGTTLSSVAQQFTQGNITSTSNSLDVAINGNGFYKVTDGSTIAYTRNGQFHTNTEGYIVNDQNFKLMGYVATSTGEIVTSDPAPLQIDTGNAPPQATGTTKNATMKLLLDSSAKPIDTTANPFSPSDPLSYNYSTSMTTYDTLGVEHAVRFYFVKGTTAAGETPWTTWATLDGKASSATNIGTLQFDSSGKLDSPASGIINLPKTSPPAADWTVSTGAVSPIGTGQSYWAVDFTGSNSYSGESTVNAMTQDGYGQGALSSISISAKGIIQGNYSNGQTKNLGQIVLTTFTNNNGLNSLGNNLYQATEASGQGMDGAPRSGVRGALQSSAIEESNVDLTGELVNMITLQRNYQANAQTIKTQDSILQTLVSLR